MAFSQHINLASPQGANKHSHEHPYLVSHIALRHSSSSKTLSSWPYDMKSLRSVQCSSVWYLREDQSAFVYRLQVKLKPWLLLIIRGCHFREGVDVCRPLVSSCALWNQTCLVKCNDRCCLCSADQTSAFLWWVCVVWPLTDAILMTRFIKKMHYFVHSHISPKHILNFSSLEHLYIF